MTCTRCEELERQLATAQRLTQEMRQAGWDLAGQLRAVQDQLAALTSRRVVWFTCDRGHTFSHPHKPDFCPVDDVEFDAICGAPCFRMEDDSDANCHHLLPCLPGRCSGVYTT